MLGGMEPGDRAVVAPGDGDGAGDPGGPRPTDDLDALARALADVGRAVRDAVRGGLGRDGAGEADRAVVRTEGGDDVFGIDARAEVALVAGLAGLAGFAGSGTAVVEGHDRPLPVGDGTGPWRYLIDPVDGTRPLLAGKRSAWVLLGAGRHARTLEDLEIGVAVEIPTRRAAVGLVAWAVRGGPAHAVDDDLVGGTAATPATLVPRSGPLERTFVTVVRVGPGSQGAIGAWLDDHLAGLEVYDDLVPCSGQQLLGVASGQDTAVLDPRPLFGTDGLAAHPYDLAALVVARAAGAVVEALPPGPLEVPLDTTTPVAWAAYADDAVAARLRPPPGSLPPR